MLGGASETSLKAMDWDMKPPCVTVPKCLEKMQPGGKLQVDKLKIICIFLLSQMLLSLGSFEEILPMDTF